MEVPLSPMEVSMSKYIVPFATALYLFFSPIQALAINPCDIIKLKKAGVSDKVIIAVVDSNAVIRAIISVDEIIAMKSMPEVVLAMIENANRPVHELERQDSKDFALKRKIKRTEMELELQRKRNNILSEHLHNLITNPEILKLVESGKIASKDFADITKYLKQAARDEDSVDYREDIRLDADINIKETRAPRSKKKHKEVDFMKGVDFMKIIE